MFQRILVPVDFSQYGDEILKIALEMARKFDASIDLIHVIPNMDYFTPYESFMAAENIVAIQKGVEGEVEKDLDEVALKLPGITVKKAIRTGVAFVEILDYVKSEGIDLIIMGTKGRGGLEHIIIGSVAEKVLRKSPCPVLAIRPPKKHGKGS
jgi:nucleotide-binding universal stress UspA family protein